MRAFFMQNRGRNLFRRAIGPAGTVFLLLAAFGVSAGLASLQAAGEGGVLSETLTGGWSANYFRSIAFAAVNAIAWSSLVLVSGLHPTLLPIWLAAVLIRSFSAGLGIRFALALRQSAGISALLLIVTLFPLFPVEFALGSLPLQRWTSKTRGEDPERYLAAGLRLTFLLAALSAGQGALQTALLRAGLPA